MTLTRPADEAEALAMTAIAVTLRRIRASYIPWRELHEAQRVVAESPAKRRIWRGGRRIGKTILSAHLGVRSFLDGRRILYAAPTAEQLDTFWREIKRLLHSQWSDGHLYKNETMRLIEREGTENRIRAKTAWNADTLRGDYADFLILDEWQLMDEDAWDQVGAPMLLDNDGDVLFIYTPPSLHSRSISKARDPRHAARMFERASKDTTGRWAAFTAPSTANPYLSRDALDEIAGDMSALAYRQEIMAEDLTEVPGALWSRNLIDGCRNGNVPALSRIIVGVDPPGGQTECGIVVVGVTEQDGLSHGYVLADYSLAASPDVWAAEVLSTVADWGVDQIVGEANFGGDMVESVIRQAARSRDEMVRYKAVTASRGKAVRAEPVVALYEQGRVHHAGSFPYLEDEMCQWAPGQPGHSPNRLDALVWALTELMLKSGKPGMRWLTY